MLLAAITAAAAGLRFAELGLQSYWFDESVTVDLVRRSFVGMLRAIPGSESTPPLYYMVAWVWAKAFGTGAVGLRSLSALFGTATVPAAYAAGRVLSSVRTALIAAVLVAVSPILVWYSQEARAYAMLTFLAAVALWFFARAFGGGHERRDLVRWGVAAGLSLATHYFAVFFVAPQAVWLLVRTRGRRDALVVVGAVGAVAVALLPLAVHQERGGRTAWIHASPLRSRIRDTAHFFLSGFYPLAHAGALALAAGAFAIVGLWTWVRGADRRGGRVALAIGGAALGLPLLLALASRGLGGHGDYFFFRNMIAAWVPLAIAVAAAAGSLARRGVVVACGVAAVAVLLVLATVRVDQRPDLQRDDWRGVARALGSTRPGRVVVISPDWEAAALKLYRPALSPLAPGGAMLDDIVVVAPVFGTTPPGFNLPAGFTESRRVVQHFALIDARAKAPRRITVGDILPSPRDRPGTAVLLDR